MNIQPDAVRFIHKDSKAKLGADGLMGNKLIIIYGGTATAPLIAKTTIL